MILENLNEEQKKAVELTEGPLLILAGAGSGKTKVLTTRIAYLIENKKIQPENILAITFTNKAANEMKKRIIGLLGKLAYDIQISTFHSFGLLILKENYSKLNYDKNFYILDTDDVLTIIKKIMSELNIDNKVYNPKMIKNKISNCKNSLITALEYEKYANNEVEKKVVKIYEKYEEKLKKSNALDFDDLLMLPILLFRKFPEVLQSYQERYKYILIDEYQDINEAQYILTKMIGDKYKNICVVGDESQAIYSFRGSNYRNILNFEKDYPKSSIIMLEKNYRSTKMILNVANDVIKNNLQRKDKKLWTDNEEGVKVVYNQTFNEKREASYVVQKIKELLLSGTPKSEIVILYRTNAQSRNIEEAVLKENIPYKVIGSFYFYKRKEIKDLIAYLKIIYNQNDDNSLLRIINVPKRGIGAKTLSLLTERAILNKTSIYDVISSGKELEFKNLIEELKLLKEKISLTELVDIVLEKSGMKKDLQSEKSVDAEIRLENLEEFKTITKEFEEKYGIISLEEFLHEISLVSDVTEYRDETDVITLMTIHSAKGLEFSYVFIVGLEEGILPHTNSLTNSDDLEEERRLFYVAITRAKKLVWLICTEQRTIFGLSNLSIPSRFINEINKKYLEIENDILVSDKKSEKDLNDMIDSDVEYKIGDKVIHDVFGKGFVVMIDKKIITIAFSNKFGIKQMIKGHKSIKKI